MSCFRPLIPRVKPWLIRSFLTLDSKTERATIRWKAVEQYFAVVLFVFQLQVRNCGKFTNFGPGRLSGVKGLTRDSYSQ